MSDYGDIDDDEENNGFDNVLNNSKAKGLDEVFDPDAEYEGEFGYNLVKALRGRSPGRKLRRTLFKLGLFQVLCGFSLSIIAFEAGINLVGVVY